jgi:hypothetical protein
MEPSPELEAVAHRRAEAFNTRDNETMLNLYADEPGLIVIVRLQRSGGRATKRCAVSSPH